MCPEILFFNVRAPHPIVAFKGSDWVYNIVIYHPGIYVLELIFAIFGTPHPYFALFDKKS